MSDRRGPILTATNLSKKFGREQAVDGVSIEVAARESLCIVGPNGAGKTTFLLLLGGVLLPSNGHVTVFGLDRWRSSFDIRRRSTFLTATPIFGASDTPLQFLRFFAQIYGMEKGMFRVRLEELAAGLEMLAHLGKPWRSLSLGMIKKAGLIAALLPDAELRIFDEPFAGGIDPFAMDFLFQRFNACCTGGETIIFSTQVLEQAQTAAHRIMLMEAGRMSAIGTPDELFERAGVAPGSPRALYETFHRLVKRPSE